MGNNAHIFCDIKKIVIIKDVAIFLCTRSHLYDL